jgi:hypothetical protein
VYLSVSVTLVVAALVVSLIFGMWWFVFGRYSPQSGSALRMIDYIAKGQVPNEALK